MVENIIWKKHYNLNYNGSNNGQIKNSKTNNIVNGRILNSEKVVQLSKKNYLVKNFLYECFYGKIPDNHYIVYIDGIINNHNINNLKLVNEEGLKEYKQEQLNKIKEIKIIEGWKPHYKFINYLGNDQGQIFSLYSNEIIMGHNVDNYIRINIHHENKLYNRYAVHRFIYECFNGEIQEKLQIDHINGISIDNSIKNLQILNSKEHNIKTFSNNNSRKKQADKLKKKILLEEFNDNNELINKKEYKCADELIPILNLSRVTIGRYAKNNKKFLNYKLSYIDEDKLEDEEWKIIEDDERFNGYLFSNMGRIKNQIGKITYGNINVIGYNLISIGLKKYNVHYLICLAFNGKPDGEYGNEITVDHIDRNRTNNKSVNLKWATRIEQATNTIKVKKVKAYYADTNEEIGEYVSASEAGRQYNIDSSGISKVCKNKRKTFGKLNNRPIKWSFL